MSSIRKRAPKASSERVRFVMQRNVGHETEPEMKLRSALHKLGLRFRKDCNLESKLKIKADIVFPKPQVCVFVDGCFWHGCPLHFKVPKTHSAWWKEKIDDNKRRDLRQTRALKRRGWKVLRLWEHEITEKRLSKISVKIKNLINA